MIDDVPELRIDHRAHVIEPRGTLDAAATGKFLDAVKSVTQTMTSGSVTIDLQHVVFMDSSGLGALVAATNVAQLKGLRLELRSTPARITRLIRMTGLGGVFGVGAGTDADPD